MDPMFLPDVERYDGENPRAHTIRTMQASGIPVPQIMHLFAYRFDRTRHLERFTQEVLRGPSPLSPGQRELIAAFTAKHRECPF